MGQIALPLSNDSRAPDGHIIVTDCNRALVAQLDNARNWPFQAGLLIGAGSSGKTAIGAIFAAAQDRIFVDDADRHDDTELFHIWNEAQRGGQALLMASRLLPSEWDTLLPDLKSRLGASQTLMLTPPDDDMRAALLHKLLAARGLAMADGLVEFALVRLERSYAAVAALAGEIDRLTLERKSPIGQRLVSEATAVASAQMDLPI